MAFVRVKRTPKGTPRHYLVTSERVNGKSRQRVLAYLGGYATVEEALEKIGTDLVLTKWGIRHQGQCPRWRSWRATHEQKGPGLLRHLEALQARLRELQEEGVVPKLCRESDEIWARHKARMEAAG